MIFDAYYGGAMVGMIACMVNKMRTECGGVVAAIIGYGVRLTKGRTLPSTQNARCHRVPKGETNTMSWGFCMQ